MLWEKYWETYKLLWVKESCFALTGCSMLSTNADSLGTIVDLNQIHFLLREACDCLCAHSSSSTARTAEMVFSGERGRPRYRITEEQIHLWLIVDSLSGKYRLRWEGPEGVSKTQTSKLQTSDLRPRKLRPRKTQTSKLQTPWKIIEVVNAVLCIFLYDNFRN